jgi:hypothetical protein
VLRTHRSVVILAGLLLMVLSVASTSVARERSTKCTISGSAGKDDLTGTAGPDVICGFGGDDHLYGGGGNDLLIGGGGNDRVYGEDGNDVSKGGAGADGIFDTKGLDRLLGGDGNEICVYAKDGQGGDLVDGGTGKDIYAANTLDTKKNVEVVGICPPDFPH